MVDNDPRDRFRELNVLSCNDDQVRNGILVTRSQILKSILKIGCDSLSHVGVQRVAAEAWFEEEKTVCEMD